MTREQERKLKNAAKDYFGLGNSTQDKVANAILGAFIEWEEQQKEKNSETKINENDEENTNTNSYIVFQSVHLSPSQTLVFRTMSEMYHELKNLYGQEIYISENIRFGVMPAFEKSREIYIKNKLGRMTIGLIDCETFKKGS